MLRILFIGDVVGRPGRKALKEYLPLLKAQQDYDFILANGENAAGGIGLTPETAEEIFQTGVHCLTGGNHTFEKKEIYPLLEQDPRLLRPANYPPSAPGRGWNIYPLASGVKIGVINLMGRTFMPPLDDPFRTALELLHRLKEETPIIVIDFHAEATSEKQAIGWFLSGQVSAVIGTHTHVQTADERLLGGTTGYITDVGMTGPWESILGVKKEQIIDRFLSCLPVRFEVAKGPIWFSAVELEIDPSSGRCTHIRRISEILRG